MLQTSQHSIKIHDGFSIRLQHATPLLQTYSCNLFCRCLLGNESPEVAESLLRNGSYVPRWNQDMWSLGLLMLDLMYGQRPAEQQRIRQGVAHMRANAKGERLPAHLQYLADQLTDPVPYAAKVKSPTSRSNMCCITCRHVTNVSRYVLPRAQADHALTCYAIADGMLVLVHMEIRM